MKRSRKLKTHGVIISVAAAAVLTIAVGAIPQEATPVEEAVESTETAGLNGDVVTMTRPDTFNIHVKGADLRGVLQLLSTQGKRNIIATEEIQGTVSVDLYDVTFEEALDAVMKSSGFRYEIKDGFVYVYTSEQYAAIQAAEREKNNPIEVKVYRLHYITANDARDLVSPVLSEEGSITVSPASATGISSPTSNAGGNAYALNDMLIVTDRREHHEVISEHIETLDVRPQQVLIEATVLQANLTEDNALGIDFTALAGVDFRALSASTDFSGVETEDVTDGDTFDQTFGRIKTGFSSQVSSGGLEIGWISNEIGMFLRALEGVTDTTVLANPKLMVLNKHVGEVMIGQRDGYLTTTVTDTVATQAVRFLETGTRLIVRPYIGKNGFIRMEIHPEDSTGSVTQIGNAALPTETTTEVTSNVLVHDGHTIVIGGLFRETTTATRSQIPVAGNIPGLGPLFRSTKDSTKRAEVIILITPRIISQEAAAAVGDRLSDDVTRLHLGARKGLTWWGQEQLADRFVRWARKDIRLGRRQQALWNLDLALHMKPQLLEAIRMKERLTEKAYWSSAVKHMSTRYILQRMVMQDLGKPVERIIPPFKPINTKRIEQDVRETFGIEEKPQDPLPGQLRCDFPKATKPEEQDAVKEEESHAESD